MAACVDSCRARQSKVEARGHLLLLHKSIPKKIGGASCEVGRVEVRARRQAGGGRGASHERCACWWASFTL